MEGFFWKDWFDNKHLWMYLLKVIQLIFFYIVFRIVTNFVLSKIFRTIKHSKNKIIHDNPVTGLIFSSIKILLNLLFILLALPILGVKTTSLVAFIGTLGLGLGLGLKDIFTDILSGLKLVLTKPFSVGDRIRYGEIEGTVHVMNITHTIVFGDTKNMKIHIPNRLLAENVIVNFSRQDTKLIEIKFPVPQNISVEDVRVFMIPYLSKYLISKEEPKVQLESIHMGYNNIICSFWGEKVLNNRDVQAEILESLKEELDKKGVVFPNYYMK